MIETDPRVCDAATKMTLADVLTTGDLAADAGTPLVANWPQARASFLLLDRTMGLASIPSNGFLAIFSGAFDDLDDAMQQQLPGARVYDIVRREVERVLAALGHGDAWEAQRVLLRKLGRRDLEHGLSPMRTAAKLAKLHPTEITADWIWALDAECTVARLHPMVREARGMTRRLDGVAFRIRRQIVAARRLYRYQWVTRQQLRRAVVHLDSLFDIPEFVASGLLPPKRIGAPPRYDRRGRLRVPLPPLLAKIDADASRSTPKNLSELWQAIHAAGGLGLPANPSADELLAERTWDRIRALPASILGVSDQTWTIYCSRARTALRRNSMHPM